MPLSNSSSNSSPYSNTPTSSSGYVSPKVSQSNLKTKDISLSHKHSQSASELAGIYSRLLGSGYFCDPKVTKYGYMSFLRPERLWPESDPLALAQKLKRQGDSLYNQNRHQAYRLWLESLVLHLQESTQSLAKIQNLAKFVHSIRSLIRPDDKQAQKVFLSVYLCLEYAALKWQPPSKERLVLVDQIVQTAYQQETPIVPFEYLSEYATRRLNLLYYN
ncbi:hypothetical protein NEHOM01_0785 [Nematocida homosporus]|uniref:uncharacterized protein n=1 Tax=Nematocida homosporus TaxID=1912981 RepID=UPI00221F5752|nr:uncharacterized protein NEHOM01_0785 [Nematocida homosporus]KAI5185370.1 hypothetical protein NEHOM01_0785 [Nematocida homosporus]